MAIHQIKAKLPGMFYQHSAPDQPPYKKQGDTVSVGETIGLIEVMKSYHEVKSDINGIVKDYAVGNEDPIAPGQVLIEVEISNANE